MIVAKSNLYVFIVLSIFAISQFFIDNSLENIFSASICFICSLIGCFYILRAWDQGYYLSTITLIGCLIGTQIGPLLFQTFYLTPVVFNLRLPYITFSNTALFFLSLITGHFFYKNINFFKKLRYSFFNSFNKIGVFSPVSGFFILTLTAMSFISIYSGAVNDIETGDVGNKFFAIFSVFSILPLAYFAQEIQNTNKNRKWAFFIIFIYFILLICLGILKNSRGLFGNFALCFIMVLSYFIYIKRVNISRNTFFVMLILVWPLILIIKLLVLVSGAILLARGGREEIKGFELLKYSFGYLEDIISGAIKEYGVNVNSIYNINSYNELYLKNDFLSRLVTIKFNDNIFFYSSQIDSDKYFTVNEFFVNRLISTFPQPIINWFTNQFNKDDYVYSYGDWIHYLAEGAALGGFKLGSLVGSGINLFNYFFFLLVIIFSPFFYSFVDSLVKVDNSNGSKKVELTIISILVLYTLFLIPNSDSLMTLIGFFTRDFLQILFIYLLFLYFYKFFIKVIKN